MNEIVEILTQSISKLIANSTSAQKIAALKKKHDAKLHFIPYKYRLFGGLLQSMNIQFGNFLERVVNEVLRRNPENEVIEKYSGKKNMKFHISRTSEAQIDDYIARCQSENYSEAAHIDEYNKLLRQIYINETSASEEVVDYTHDVDVLFRNKRENIYYYVELKYNDDHDTGKFVDINRKILKTYAYLQRELGKGAKLIPLLYYFNNKKMKGNIFLPETCAIYRGKKFFDAFATISYNELDACMKNISENEETKKIFDDLYHKVVG